MRINRFLALSGLGARRKCEILIREGRVEVNGTTIETPGFQVDPERDRVVCDGIRVRPAKASLYLMMNKPSGVVVSAQDERGRMTVYDLLPDRLRGKVRAVGRLDRGSEGLLLFTNDGTLSHALLHPSRGVERLYLAWVAPPPGMDAIASLRRGVALGEGERSGPATVRLQSVRGGTARVRVGIREGRNREVRRMFRSVGCRVLALRRVAYGTLALGHMRAGQVRPLALAEVAALKKSAGIVERK